MTVIRKLSYPAVSTQAFFLPFLDMCPADVPMILDIVVGVDHDCKSTHRLDTDDAL
jgi:hypothetical protein